MSAVFAGVNSEAEARVGNSEVGGELWYHVNENVRGKLLVLGLEMCNALNVFLRNNQYVNRSFRRQVFERDNTVVLVNFLRGNFSAILQKIQSDI